MYIIVLGHLITLGVIAALAVYVAQVVISGAIADRNWNSNDIKIMQIMSDTPEMHRSQAAEVVVRENMKQEQLDISARSALAQERTSESLMLNTGLNFSNAFNK